MARGELRYLTVSAALMSAGCSLLLSTSDLSGGGGDTNGPSGDGGGLDGGSTDGATSQDGTTPIDAAGAAKITLSAAGDHTCAIVDGKAYCWGDNAYGEIGDGTKTPRPTPTPVKGLPGVVTALSPGQTHTCAIASGEVYCWGAGNAGQLGLPNTAVEELPVRVPGLPGEAATDVAAGLGFTCASYKDGTQCWGANDVGRLGDGTDGPGRETPAPVVKSVGALTGVTQLSGTNDHACARTDSNEAFCWGHNDNGALGNPSAGGYSNKAVPVTPLSADVKRVSIGGFHACALLTTGGVWCWGTGTDGELGNGGSANSPSPVAVSGLGSGATWMATAGGPDYGDATCAVQNGDVLCWGNGQFGRLGDQGTMPRAVPAKVPLPEPAVSVAGGFTHFCALLASGQIRCWGRGHLGQLGDGASTDRPMPTVVQGF